MSIKPGLCGITSAGLIVGLTLGLTGCGTSDTTGSAATSTPADASTSNPPTSEPVTPTTSSSPDSAPSKSAAPAAEETLITIKGFKYQLPASVAPGSKIMVKNEDAEAHTVTSAEQGAFEISAPPGGETTSFAAPTKPGSYPFVCTLHGNMKGTLVVK